jgi:Cu(I)/Ag(I) efflux system membrane fusion protein
MRASLSFALIALLAAATIHAQSIRDRIRLKGNRTTTVTEAQANELTLTLTAATVRPIQIWLRLAGAVDDARKAITATAPAAQASRVRVGQRVRAFSPESRSRMHQATVSNITSRGDDVVITMSLVGQPLEQSRFYVIEIVTEDREMLSVPNEAIIDVAGKATVYVQSKAGGYEPREIMTGVQGELFTQVLDGLQEGDQVVTIGSFFIDAEHKLKGS